MIDLVRHYVDLLSRDSIEPAEIVEDVGRAIADPGIPMPIQIAPASPRLRSASLGRYRDTGQPFLLRLEPAPGHRPLLAALVSAFGESRRSRTDRGMPAVYVIDPAGAGGGNTVALIITVAEANGSGDLLAAEIALRRDPATTAQDAAGAGSAP
jgi:hypothetical protein